MWKSTRRRESDDRRVFLFPGTVPEFFSALKRAGFSAPLAMHGETIGSQLESVGLIISWDADERCTVVGTREAMRRWYERDRGEWPPEGLEVCKIERRR